MTTYEITQKTASCSNCGNVLPDTELALLPDVDRQVRMPSRDWDVFLLECEECHQTSCPAPVRMDFQMHITLNELRARTLPQR